MFYYVLLQIVPVLLLLKEKGSFCNTEQMCIATYCVRALPIYIYRQTHNAMHRCIATYCTCKCSPRTAPTCARAHFCPDPSVGANLSCFALPRFIALMNCTCTLDPPTQLNVNIQVQQQDNLQLTPNNEKIVHPLKMFMIL